MIYSVLLTSRIKNKLSAILTILYCAGIKISYLLVVIRKIKREELSLVRDFAPPDWSTDLEKPFGRYYDQPWFYAVIVADGRIRGYYLPDLGKGMIIADMEVAGIELLKFKITRERSIVCIPEANAVAMAFLVSIGYQPYLRATRMYLGKNIVWQPGKVYARGSGALG
jgi:hypothetical protein